MPRKKRVKCPPNAKSLACGFAFKQPFDRLLCHRSREYIFVILREVMTLTFFAVTSRGCKLLCSIASDDERRLIFMLYRNERTTIIHFSSYCMHERAMTTWYHEERAGARRIVMSERFYCCSQEKRRIFTRCIARSDGDERIFTSYPRRRWRNCVREHVSHCEDETTNTFFRSIAREWAK